MHQVSIAVIIIIIIILIIIIYRGMEYYKIRKGLKSELPNAAAWSNSDANSTFASLNTSTSNTLNQQLGIKL